MKPQFRDKVHIELLKSSGAEPFSLLLPFFNAFDQGRNVDSEVLRLENDKLRVGFFEIIHQPFEILLDEQLVVGGGKLNDPLKEEPLVLLVPEPDLFPCFVAVPEFAGVEELNSTAEFFPVFGRHFNFIRPVYFFGFFLRRVRGHTNSVYNFGSVQKPGIAALHPGHLPSRRLL